MFMLPVLSALAVLVLLHESFASMAEQWSSSTTFTYGFFVAPVALGLIWSRRGALRRVGRSPVVLPLLLMLPVAVAWWAGMVLHVQTLHQLAAVALLVLAVWASVGHAAVRIIAFPMLYLFFMVPFGEALVPWLMRLTADAAVLGVRLAGVPVFQDGFLFSLPSGDFEVIKACSGIRFLMTTLAAGAVFAWLAYRSPTKRLLFMLACVAVPIAANLVRTFGVVMVAHASDLRFGAGADHVIAGTVFFAAVLLALFVVGARFADAPAHGGAAAIPMPAQPPLSRADAGVFGGVLAIVLVAATLPALVEQRREALSMVELPVLPGDFGRWARGTPEDESWRPRFDTADAELLVRYRPAAGHPAAVDFYSAAYGVQTEERELTSSLNRVHDAPWRALDESRHVLRLDTRALPLAEAVIGTSGDGGRVVWYWYSINGIDTPDRLRAKLLELGALLRGEALAASVIVLSSPYPVEPDEARAALESWLRDLCGQASGAAWKPQACGG